MELGGSTHRKRVKKNLKKRCFHSGAAAAPSWSGGPPRRRRILGRNLEHLRCSS